MILDKKIHIFLTIAENGSFSRTARQLSLSQSVVSFHIDALETELGVSLFKRQGRSISLTHEGELLFENGKKLARDARNVENELSSLSNHIENRIFLGGDAMTCVFTLPWTLASYSKEHPETVFAYQHLNHEDLKSKILNGDLDLALTGHPIRDRKISSQQCFCDEIILAAGPDYSGAPLDVEDIQSIPLIWAKGDYGLELLLTKALKKAGVHVTNLKIFMEVEGIAMLKNFVRAGIGFAFLPKVAIADELKYGLLKEVAVKELSLERKTHLVNAKDKHMRETVKGFIDYIHTYIHAQDEICDK
ncbi:LysR substrate-binding domain-containing protein [Candidatus Latescibacterota bacterium]